MLLALTVSCQDTVNSAIHERVQHMLDVVCGTQDHPLPSMCALISQRLSRVQATVIRIGKHRKVAGGPLFGSSKGGGSCVVAGSYRVW